MSLFIPDFFILGAAKAGTTSLYDLLNEHSQIKMSIVKEPMFFSRDDYYQRGLDWYSKTFFSADEEDSLFGEASPHYLFWADKVAPRIHESAAQKELKFIVILRDPVDRAYSWYWNMIKEGEESLPFEQAIAKETDRLRDEGNALRASGSMIYGYKKGSMYAEQIKAFLNHFPKENFFFLLQEDLQSKETRQIIGLFNFLGTSSDPIKNRAARRNPASMPRSRKLQGLLRNTYPIKDKIKFFIPFRVRQAIKNVLTRMNSAPFSYPEINAESERMLRKYFAAEVRELQNLVGRDLSHWLPQTEEQE